ncbi:MAG: 6-phosphogluconolactonase [Acidobacteriota bacterium]
MPAQRLDLRVFPDPKRLSQAVAAAFSATACEKASLGKRFSVALTGGRTPRLLYQELATDFRAQVPWTHTHFFWSDERYVPPNHPDSNQRLARESFLDHVPIPPENIHAPLTHLEYPEEAAVLYEKAMKEFFSTGEPGFDWVLLGLGEDGHIASLFPGSPTLDAGGRWVVFVDGSPKPPPQRLTMTLAGINRAACVHFLVTGTGKKDALRASLEGAPDPRRFPAHGVRPENGTVTWWTDASAAAGLSEAFAGTPS